MKNFILSLWCSFEINFYRENSAFDKEIPPTHGGTLAQADGRYVNMADEFTSEI